MNLDYLKTLLELVRLGSFSAVAKELAISQPAVSFQIQKLEHDLGVRLLNRNQRRVSLTDAGRRVMEFARAMDNEETRLLRDLDRLREELVGELMITASTTPGELLLPSLMGEFLALHPATKAQVVAHDSLDVIKGVQDGLFEVGFCGAVPPKGKGLEFFKIAEDEIALIVFPEHPFATRKHVAFAEIAGEAIIAREPTSGTQKSLEALLTRAGLDLSAIKPRLMLGSAQAVISAVESRAGIAFVSSLAIGKSLKAGTLRQVSIEDIKLKRDFFCVYYGERLNSRLMQEFIAFIRARSVVS